MVAYTPVDQKTQSSPKALFDAAVASLQDMGYNLDEQDPATFHVKTAQRTHNVSELSHEKYRYVWTVDTADGRLEIRLTCEKNSGTHASEYKSCGAEAPAHLVDEQQKIRDAIVKQAGGG